MASFVALYRGPSIASARLIGATSDADAVDAVARVLIDESVSHETDEGDPVVVHWEESRRRALASIRGEVTR